MNQTLQTASQVASHADRTAPVVSRPVDRAATQKVAPAAVLSVPARTAPRLSAGLGMLYLLAIVALLPLFTLKVLWQAGTCLALGLYSFGVQRLVGKSA